MPFDGSSADEHPGSITADNANRCAACGHHRREHNGPCGCGLCLGFVEPKGSASSSPDDLCQCGHARRLHWAGRDQCCRTVRLARSVRKCGCAAFAPADAETAGPTRREPIDFGSDGDAKCGACGHVLAEHHWHQICGSDDPERDKLVRLFRMLCMDCARLKEPPVHDVHEFVPITEPEAPECEHPFVEKWGFRRQCFDCREWLDPKREVAPPRRPPYAVAYEIGDGRLYEVALAGDAVATVEDGVLKVSHPEGVVHMIRIKPMEGA